jgi:hypothetical protein
MNTQVIAGPGSCEIGHLLVDPKSRAEGGDVGGIDPPVHRHAPDPRLLHAADRDGALVCRTLEDLRRLAHVVPEQAVGEVLVDVPVAAVGRIEVERAIHPLARPERRGKPVLVVVHVETPADHQLTPAVHALDTQGLGLGLAQGWQQHAGEDGDDGDHHQQFDQGEGPGGPLSEAGHPQGIGLGREP